MLGKTSLTIDDNLVIRSIFSSWVFTSIGQYKILYCSVRDTYLITSVNRKKFHCWVEDKRIDQPILSELFWKSSFPCTILLRWYDITLICKRQTDRQIRERERERERKRKRDSQRERGCKNSPEWQSITAQGTPP